MTRRPIFAANWKMNKSVQDTLAYCTEFSAHKIDPAIADVVIIPPFTAIATARQSLPASISVGAQNVSNQLSGAFTGEVSVSMLAGIGCNVVVIGHSERRAIFNETPAMLSQKLERVLDAGLTAIFCIGETLAERDANQTESILSIQLQTAFKPILHLLSDKWTQLVIAYEPVWAIGTGKVASADQAQATHQFIRSTLNTLLGPTAAAHIRIQYGGSVKPDNVAELMRKPDIDGALVGGASLAPESFYEIIKKGVTL
jgi:triosephosphate isomerase